MADDLENKRAPWLRMGMDWEGVAAALGALLVGILLGWVWDPLFWIGFAGAVIAIFAGRWARRTPPDMASAIVAPCDGVVVSIDRAEVPSELRMEEAFATRIRLSTGPMATNKLYAPIAGGVQTMIHEAGDNSVPFANGPADHGLTEVYLTLESLGEELGVRVSTGGLGPRLEMTVDAGDSVRLGRAIGTRRLGGWCDVYVPSKIGQLVWPGQSVVGGETVMGRMGVSSDAELFEEAADDADVPGRLPQDVETEDDAEDAYSHPEDISAPSDPAEMFARLKEAAKDVDGSEG